MKSKLLLILAITSLLFVGCGKVDKKPEYNYMGALKSAEAIRDNKKIVFVDIQVEEDFEEEHLRGAIATYSYPVKTPKEHTKLLSALAKITVDDKVVVVCPRGGGGAERAYDLLAKNGIEKSRLYILTDGQYGWPRDDIKDVLISE